MPTPRMIRSYASQKGALTRALRSGNPERVRAEVRRVKEEWEQTGWPDNWSAWQRALDDVGAFDNIDDL